MKRPSAIKNKRLYLWNIRLLIFSVAYGASPVNVLSRKTLSSADWTLRVWNSCPKKKKKPVWRKKKSSVTKLGLLPRKKKASRCVNLYLRISPGWKNISIPKTLIRKSGLNWRRKLQKCWSINPKSSLCAGLSVTSMLHVINPPNRNHPSLSHLFLPCLWPKAMQAPPC